LYCTVSTFTIFSTYFITLYICIHEFKWDNSFDFEIAFHIENKSTHCTYNLTGDLPHFCSGVAATRFRLVILNINHSKAILRRFYDIVREQSWKIEFNEMAAIKPKSSTVEVTVN